MSVEVKNVFTFPIFVYSFIDFPVNFSDPFRLTFTLRSLLWIISDNRSHGIMKNTWHLQRTKIWKHSSSTRLKPVHAVRTWQPRLVCRQNIVCTSRFLPMLQPPSSPPGEFLPSCVAIAQVGRPDRSSQVIPGHSNFPAKRICLDGDRSTMPS